MQRQFGVTPASVHQMILTLERSGFIRRQAGVPRSTEVPFLPRTSPSCKSRQNLCDEAVGGPLAVTQWRIKRMGVSGTYCCLFTIA
ncbi:hypothetical protein [Bradyrhizobium valentinum]|uniref:hypothetical protein n=1 Tax=Bradyrhizobium valentinum TaxID=1518501 RepID=UPI001FD9290F|nr:hypothetical protein [Bradyrhizobium valentinum]